LLREVLHPAVVALFRLALIEAERSPKVARALDEGGRKANRAALVAFLSRAMAQGLIAGGDPETIAAQFLALLWGDLLISVLMRLAEPPAPTEIEQRARSAAVAVLRRYPGHRSALGRVSPHSRPIGGSRSHCHQERLARAVCGGLARRCNFG
jgi:hypothetical protein